MGAHQLALFEEFTRPALRGSLEEQAYSRGHVRIAGLDEVGRGPLAGPVVAAAVVFPRGFSHPDIIDSKLLSATQRERLASVIERSAIGSGIGIIDVEEIDRVNILNASFQAMAQALTSLRPVPDCLLVDGDQIIPGELLDKSLFEVCPHQKAIIKGDQLCFSIAAASILAKVTRDALMVELDKKYPEYGFAEHKGYSSVAHLEALRRYGASPIHRRSFKPVRDVCSDRLDALPLFSRVGDD